MAVVSGPAPADEPLQPGEGGSDLLVPRPKKPSKLEPSFWLSREDALEAQLKVGGRGTWHVRMHYGTETLLLLQSQTCPAVHPGCRPCSTTTFRTTTRALRRCTDLPHLTPLPEQTTLG